MTVSSRVLLSLTLLLFLSSSLDVGARALAAPSAPPALALAVSPAVVDVGSTVQLTVHARRWPARASASVAFVSAHHGFTGKMTWTPSCNCFEVRVAIARRQHALEFARAVARVTVGQATFAAVSRFQIRGLAANYHDFSPGGPVLLAGWVSDASPTRHEQQHYCGWIRTVDGFGVSGYRVRFVVRFGKHTENLAAGPTGRHGVACIAKSIGFAAIGHRVTVDVYAAGEHASASFTTRA